MPVPEPLHLVARFFDVATARRLRPAEQTEVAGWLHNPTERRMFWDQPPADQRHGLAAARYVAARAPDRPDLIRAALLHDTGKRVSRLGLIGRSWASILRLVGRPGRGRIADYLDHGRLAADELVVAAAEPIVVEYARAHHGERPASVDADDWDLLNAADRVRR